MRKQKKPKKEEKKTEIKDLDAKKDPKGGSPGFGDRRKET